MATGELNQTSVELGKLAASIDAIHRELGIFREEFKEHNHKTREQVEHLLEFQNKGMGLLFGVSLIAGSIGAFLQTIWESVKAPGVH